MLRKKTIRVTTRFCGGSAAELVLRVSVSFSGSVPPRLQRSCLLDPAWLRHAHDVCGPSGGGAEGEELPLQPRQRWLAAQVSFFGQS